MTAACRRRPASAFERFITTEYTTVDAAPAADHLAGDARTTPTAAPTIDVTTGLGYPKKADDAQRNPRVALLFSDPTGSGIGAPTRCSSRAPREVDDDDLDANRERYLRESGGEAAGDQEDAPAEVHARAVRLVLHADLHQRAARAGVHLARRRPDAPSRRSTTPTWRRSARATARSRPSRTRRGRAARRRLGLAHGRARQPPPDGGALLGRARTASRSRSGCRSRVDRDARRIRARRRARPGCRWRRGAPA